MMMVDHLAFESGIHELSFDELASVDDLAGGMTPSQASHWGDAAAGLGGVAAAAGMIPVAAALFGFAAGCYIGAATM